MATLPALVDDFPEEAQQEAAGGMSDDELVSLCQQHEMRSIGYFDSEIASEQALAINYYYGKMDDLPVQEGCSSVVDNTVAVMVDNGLAAVLKPFVSADDIVSFEPRGPEDEQVAAQATEYVNYVINCDNPGFLIFHDWFKDALLTKLGIVKVWWEDQTRTEQAVVDAMGLMQARQSPEYAGEQDRGDGTFVVSMAKPDGRIRIVNVPPEELLVSPLARCIDAECPYVAHKPNNMTRSDLIEMGFDADVVMDLPGYSDVQTEEQRRQARYRDQNYGSTQVNEGLNDESQDIVSFIDEFVRADFNGDGVAELRRVMRVLDVILYNEEVDDNAFATLCPVPMPHKVYGRATADQAVEQQKIATAIKRQTLDNLYKSNNPRPVIGDAHMNEVTWDDIADTAAGAAIRVKGSAQGAIDWMVVPFSAQYSMPMLEMVQREAEERTGFQRKGNGFNAEALKKNSPDTATQAAIDENSRNERAEMVARIFAETGVKRLFKLILKLLTTHQPKERIVRLRNQWVPMDPSSWNPEMDLSISVGLGVGNKLERIQEADSVLVTLGQLADPNSPFKTMVSPQNIYNAVKRKLVATGVKNVDDYLTDPARIPPQPPQPDPEMAKVQGEMQMKARDQQFKQQETVAKFQAGQQETAAKFRQQQQDNANQIELMRAKAAAELELSRQKAAAEIQLSREKMAAEMQLERERRALEAELDMERMEREGEMKRAEMDMEADLHDNRPGGDLDK